MTFPHTLRIAETAAEAGEMAAAMLAEAIAARPSIVLGLATGGTMRGVYASLLARQTRGEVDLTQICAFNLDDYLGLGIEDEQSYATEMRRVLFAPAGIDPRRCHIPNGRAADPAKEGDRYEAAIRDAGGIDLQLLGLGVNGHIGFNEPGSLPQSRTRVVDLAPQTIVHNRKHFPPGADVPTRAISMGIATILEARRILVLATGAVKADAVSAMLERPPSTDCPASFLSRHGQVSVVLDRAAAARIGPVRAP